MPSHPRASTTTALAETLKHQLESSAAATVYVPLGEGESPTDDELKALAADGIHAEVDVVRGALAARKATDDEIAEAKAPASEPEHAPTV